MTLYNYWCEPEPDTRILFKDLVSANLIAIKSNMRWDNYSLNETTIPVVDLLKDHAISVLTKSYGMFHVEQDILDPLTADVFMYFPVLMQQLGITRLMDAYSVVKEDLNVDELVRTEVLEGEVDENSQLTLGSTNTDTNILNTQQKTTGTVVVDNEQTNILDGTTIINNTSGVESTGNRNVNLTHNMPEQAINGITGQFPVDDEGTPILTTSYAQTASENFSTSNPIATTETSNQDTDNTNTLTSDSTTTNDLTVADTGTTTRTVVGSGSDATDTLTTTNNTNTINEKHTSTATNKQYAYEIQAFLDSTDSIVAFSKWEDRFSWIPGII